MGKNNHLIIVSEYILQKFWEKQKDFVTSHFIFSSGFADSMKEPSASTF